MPQVYIKNKEIESKTPSTRALWEEVFDEDSISFLNYYYSNKAVMNEIDADVEGEVVAAMVQWNPFYVRTGTNDEEASGGIGEKTDSRNEDTTDDIGESGFLSGEEAASDAESASGKSTIGEEAASDAESASGKSTIGEEAANDAESARREGIESSCGDVCFKIPYIVGVATKKEFRHQGRMARLLSTGLKREAMRRTPFVWLIPADGAIYTPFGFRFVGTKYQVELTGAGKGAKCAICFREVDENNSLAVSDFLNTRLGELYDIFAIRDSAYLADARMQYESDGGGIVAICSTGDDEGGSVEGFFTWWPEDGQITVRELVLSRRLEAAGWPVLEPALREWFEASMLSPKESKGKISVFTTGWSGKLVTETPVQSVMIRVADIKSFLEMFSSCVPYRIILHVKDDIIEENNQSFLWAIGPAKTTATPYMENTSDKTSDDHLYLSVSELVSWLTGDKGFDQLDQRYGGIRKKSRIHLPECV